MIAAGWPLAGFLLNMIKRVKIMCAPMSENMMKKLKNMISGQDGNLAVRERVHAGDEITACFLECA